MIELDADCCGIAGTYGLKKEKYEISMAVGERLFRDVKDAGADLAACDSETCRWQIAHGTGVGAVHPVELPTSLRARSTGHLVVGLVIVSHSATLAEGVAELARGMGAEVPIELAGGIDVPEPALGTDAAQVLEAIERADQGDGVLVLMDLGSAVLSAEMALDLLPEERRERVVLSEAPLVEGAVAAAVTAKLGASLVDVAAEARGALEAKATHLGSGDSAAPVAAVTGNGSQTITLNVRNPLGLHARPAARFVQTAGSFDADVTVTNLTAGRGPASGRSLNAIATLGVRRGHEIAIAASGAQAGEALAAVEALAARDFDEEVAVQPPAPPVARPQAGPPGALVGLPAAPGIAFGAARHFRAPAPEIPTEPAADPQAEWDALQRALERVRVEIRVTRDSVAARAGEYSAAIFDAHLLFLEDEALLEPTHRAIFDQRRNAAQAWHEAAETVAAEYRSLDDEYLRARAEDLGRRGAPGRRRARGRGGAGGCRGRARDCPRSRPHPCGHCGARSRARARHRYRLRRPDLAQRDPRPLARDPGCGGAGGGL